MYIHSTIFQIFAHSFFDRDPYAISLSICFEPAKQRTRIFLDDIEDLR